MEKILRKILRVPLESPAPDPVFDPDLDLQFARDLALDHRITFSRASHATVVDSDGTLKWAGHNLLTFSEFDSADPTDWTASSLGTGSVTLGSSLHNLPTLTFEQTVSGREFTSQSHTFEENTEYKLVLFIDESESFYTSGSGTVFAVVGLDDATGTQSAQISAAVNGVLTLSFSTGSDTSGTIRLGVGPFGNSVAKLVCAGVHLYKADRSMQERTDVATGLETYYPTTSSAVYAARFDHDPATGESLGLLIEEQRTNLIPYSENFDQGAWFKNNLTVSADSATAPDGTSNADKIISDSGLSGYIFEGVSITSGNDYTHTVFAKSGEFTSLRVLGQANAFGANIFADFDLSAGTVGSVTGGSGTASIEDFGSGWYRCVLTLAATATVTSGFQIRPVGTGDGSSGVFVFGAQLEEAAFPTSYIPTSGAAATRAVEAAKIETSKFRYSEPQGTFLVEVQTAQFGSDKPYIYSLNDNTSSNRIFQRIEDGATTRYTGVSGNTTRWSIPTGSVQTSAAFFKSATAYLVENIFVATDGGNTGSATSAVSPTGLLELDIGSSRSSSTNRLNGHIKQIQYFARRLNDETVVALTQPSLEPSLSLVFDSSETSFVDTELTR